MTTPRLFRQSNNHNSRPYLQYLHLQIQSITTTPLYPPTYISQCGKNPCPLSTGRDFGRRPVAYEYGKYSAGIQLLLYDQ